MLKEVDELFGQVVKAIPVRKRQEIKFYILKSVNDPK